MDKKFGLTDFSSPLGTKKEAQHSKKISVEIVRRHALWGTRGKDSCSAASSTAPHLAYCSCLLATPAYCTERQKNRAPTSL